MNELLKITDLSVRDEDRALLREVSLSLRENETLAFIGESGSGKTLTLKAILSLLPDDVKVTGGSVRLAGRDMYGLKAGEKRRLLGENVGFVPQNTVNYLHPLLRIGSQMCDGYVTFHGRRSRKEAEEKAVRLLKSVGINDPERVMTSYPAELSGGMRQRVNIEGALMMDPPLLIYDEPTSALDRIVQKQVADLYLSLLEERKLSLIIVSHDLVFVSRIADRIAVFYSGRIVESGTKDELFTEPVHPYTKALLALSPSLEQDRKEPLKEIKGYISEDDRKRNGCPFAPRCPHAKEECFSFTEVIRLSGTHSVLCRLGRVK